MIEIDVDHKDESDLFRTLSKVNLLSLISRAGKMGEFRRLAERHIRDQFRVGGRDEGTGMPKEWHPLDELYKERKKEDLGSWEPVLVYSGDLRAAATNPKITIGGDVNC